ncbi:MAG: tetratricopeptide repeat protein [Ginsengibacter sp.]
MNRKEFLIISILLLLAFAAITYFKRSGKADPGNLQAQALSKDSVQEFWNYYNKATELRISGKTDSSITCYLKAINLNPVHKDAIYYLGIDYMKDYNFIKAEESWQKLIALNPQSERAYNQLGNLYFSQENKEYFNLQKAKTFFEKANELNKESFSPNLHLAEIALFENRTSDATTMFRKLTVTDQKNPEIVFLLGFLDWKESKLSDATGHLENSFKLYKNSVPQKTSVEQDQDGNIFLFWMNDHLKDLDKQNNLAIYQNFDQYLKRKQLELQND